MSTPTSPNLPTNEGLANDAKTFSGSLTLDLTDDEIKTAWEIIQRIKFKYTQKFQRKFNDPQNFTLDDVTRFADEFEDELKTTLAERCNILATVNVVPVLEGRPLEIEIIGALPGGDMEKYGMDHEKKAWEVRRATERGEDYLGQKK